MRCSCSAATLTRASFYSSCVPQEITPAISVVAFHELRRIHPDADAVRLRQCRNCFASITPFARHASPPRTKSNRQHTSRPPQYPLHHFLNSLTCVLDPAATHPAATLSSTVTIWLLAVDPVAISEQITSNVNEFAHPRLVTGTPSGRSFISL